MKRHVNFQRKIIIKKVEKNDSNQKTSPELLARFQPNLAQSILCFTEYDSVLFKQREREKMSDKRTALLLETSYHLSDVTHEPRFPTIIDEPLEDPRDSSTIVLHET